MNVLPFFLIFYTLLAQDCSSVGSTCSTNQTCCSTGNGTSLCCKYPNAVCCDLQDPLCCPQNYVCDPVAKKCIPPDHSPLCDACTKVIALANSSGCSFICSKLPAQMAIVCEVIQELGICQDIIAWLTNGDTAYQICGWLHLPKKQGFCYSGTCSCGYCTESLYDRCLSLPNHCPSSKSLSSSGNMLSMKKFFSGRHHHHHDSSLLLDKKYVKNHKVGICLDGKCEPGKEGCCLTCL